MLCYTTARGDLCPKPCDDLIVHCPIIQICSAVLHHIVYDSFLCTPFSKQVRPPQCATVNHTNNTAKNFPISTGVTDLRLAYARTHAHRETHSLNGLNWEGGGEGGECYCKWFPADTKIINRPSSELLTISLSLYTDSPFSFLMALYVSQIYSCRRCPCVGCMWAYTAHVLAWKCKGVCEKVVVIDVYGTDVCVPVGRNASMSVCVYGFLFSGDRFEWGVGRWRPQKCGQEMCWQEE